VLLDEAAPLAAVVAGVAAGAPPPKTNRDSFLSDPPESGAAPPKILPEALAAEEAPKIEPAALPLDDAALPPKIDPVALAAAESPPNEKIELAPSAAAGLAGVSKMEPPELGFPTLSPESEPPAPNKDGTVTLSDESLPKIDAEELLALALTSGAPAPNSDGTVTLVVVAAPPNIDPEEAAALPGAPAPNNEGTVTLALEASPKMEPDGLALAPSAPAPKRDGTVTLSEEAAPKIDAAPPLAAGAALPTLDTDP